MEPHVLPNPSPAGAKATSLGVTRFGICQESLFLTLVSRQAECPEDKETSNLSRSLRWLGAARSAFWQISLRMHVIFCH